MSRISDQAGKLTAEGMKEAGINFVCILPDIQHTSIQDAVMDDPEFFTYHHMSEEAVGFAACCGAWLGGKKPALVFTTAGLYNMCWAISAFQNFDFPLVMMIPQRGVPGETIWFMRKYVHKIEDFLRFFGIPYEVVDREDNIVGAVKRAGKTSFNLYLPSAILYTGGTIQ